jgi:hypothetical protein
MGRPIKKKFFGNLNNEQFGSVNTGSGIGGEGVASVSISNTGTLYSQGTRITFSAPQEPTGRTATGHPVFTTNGSGGFGITSIVIDDAGTGYTSAPTLTVTTASVVTQYVTNSGVTATNTMSVASVAGIAIGMRVYGGGNGGLVTAVDPVLNRVTSSLPNSTSWTNANNLKFYDQGSGFAKTVTLTSTTTNALKVMAYLLARNGGTGAKLADIVKQEASHRYLVKTSEGIGQCRLVASSALTAGQMNLVATDFNGSTYYVTKLTAHKAVLSQSTASGSFLIANSHATGWTLGAATGTVVTLANV